MMVSLLFTVSYHIRSVYKVLPSLFFLSLETIDTDRSSAAVMAEDKEIRNICRIQALVRGRVAREVVEAMREELEEVSID